MVLLKCSEPCANNTTFPIIEEYKTTLSPIHIFEIIHNEPFSFFLDSAARGGRLGKYTFIGYQPFLILKVKGKVIEISQEGKSFYKEGDPFVILKKYLTTYVLSWQSELPTFTGGVVGYFGYDLGRLIETIPSLAKDDLSLPDAFLAFYDTVLIFDHISDKFFISSSGFPEEEERLRRKKAHTRIKEWIKKLTTVKINESENVMKEMIPSQFESNFTKGEYIKAIKRAKEYIAAGEIYQVNLSQRFTSNLTIHPFKLYQRLRTLNPAPFAGYLNFDNITILSSSPERFLRISRKKVETRPIKGTRPRGNNPLDDLRFKKELLESKKDQAELVMIVDLERNDLGKVCKYGSISVPELIKLEEHPTVFHTVSTITGILKEECDHIDCLKACFPGGSITGAPKIRSMEIIEELEPTRRKIYTGSLGYLGFNGETDLNIIIRTMVAVDGKIYFQAGGGIVADSDPEKEYDETLHKAEALFSALNRNHNFQIK